MNIKKLVFSALCLALSFVLPLLTGQIPQIGSALSPMHIPVLICGFVCGWQYGLLIGFVAPILRSLLFGMPPLFPVATAMAFELATYGFVSGILYKMLKESTFSIYLNLIISMIMGRIVWGIAMALITSFTGSEFTFAAFIAGAFVKAVPGIILHIAIIPPIILAIKKAGFMLNDGNKKISFS